MIVVSPSISTTSLLIVDIFLGNIVQDSVQDNLPLSAAMAAREVVAAQRNGEAMVLVLITHGPSDTLGRRVAIKKSKNKVKNNILNLIIVFIISTIGIIILVDTFKSPISIVIPNIELILFNLYETIKDIILFFQDLL